MTSKYINATTRQLVTTRANGRCEDCGEPTALDAHHLHYRSIGDEVPDDIAALCHDCHHSRHIDPDGNWWNDPEAMQDMWFGFHWELEKPSR